MRFLYRVTVPVGGANKCRNKDLRLQRRRQSHMLRQMH